MKGNASTIGQIHKNQSDMIMETTWDRDIDSCIAWFYDQDRDDEYDVSDDLHPDKSKTKIPIEIKFFDTKLTEELLEEGFVREIISKIQTMRKEAGFEVMDHIAVSFVAEEKVAAIMERNGATIMSEVLADEISANALNGYEKEWNINGEKVTLAVVKK